MSERGILFTPDNIRAIREGRKTQTRRVMNPQPQDEWHPEVGICAYDDGTGIPGPDFFGAGDENECYISPYGEPGDRLYIKEGIILHADGRTLAGYYMDGARVTNLRETRRTAMFMPKWAARIWLEITEMRVERVQEISESDARDEGTGLWFEKHPHDGWDGDPDQYRKGYRELWDSINGKRHPWSANPWVWAITFEAHP